MNFKKFTIVLLFFVIISLTSVSAADNMTDDMMINSIDDSQNDDLLSSDVSDIQDRINNAKAGDEIDLGTNKAYDFNSSQIIITKSITIKGNNVTITGSSNNGVFSISGASDVTVSGITFKNPVELAKYGDKDFYGKAMDIRTSDNILIENCKFINYGSYGIEFSSSHDSKVQNSWFNGATTSVSGMAGTGTKAIQLMGSERISILNNTFFGQIYDSLSIASNSAYVTIENNKFINNTFAIFYGGGSTLGNKIRNNTFITCGMINTTYFSSYLNTTIPVMYSDLPYIGMKKASNYIDIVGNEFIVKDGNRIMYSEAENTEHGSPSVIGGINISNNVVKKADSSVVDESVIFYELKILLSMSIDPSDDIILKNNSFSDIPGIQKFKLELMKLEYNETSGDVKIPEAKAASKLSVVYASNGRVVVALTDTDGKAIPEQKVNYKVNGVSKSLTTDSFGNIYIEDITGLAKFEFEYYGSTSYDRCTLKAEISANPSQTNTQLIANSLTVSAASATSTDYSVTLKDANGNALKNKQVSFTFNGRIYTATTNNNGVASLKIPAAVVGNNVVTIAFTGDSNYKGSVVVSNINIVKEATKLTVGKKTFKKSAKKISVTLKSGSKALKGKKLTLKVNGKTYKATTNAKGVATFKVKLNKKGSYKATVNFAGDSVYNAAKTTSKIKIK